MSTAVWLENSQTSVRPIY